MSERAAFFDQVDQVLTILKTWSDGLPADDQPNRTTAQELHQLYRQSTVWEPLVQQLVAFDPAVLRYVARQCRSREGMMNRWVTASLGPSRGNGLLGLLLSAFASATVWGFIRSSAPAEVWLQWVCALGFVATVIFLLTLGGRIITEAHPTGRLLMVADLLEAAADLHGVGLLSPIRDQETSQTPLVEAEVTTGG